MACVVIFILLILTLRLREFQEIARFTQLTSGQTNTEMLFHLIPKYSRAKTKIPYFKLQITILIC